MKRRYICNKNRQYNPNTYVLISFLINISASSLVNHASELQWWSIASVKDFQKALKHFLHVWSHTTWSWCLNYSSGAKAQKAFPNSVWQHKTPLNCRIIRLYHLRPQWHFERKKLNRHKMPSRPSVSLCLCGYLWKCKWESYDIKRLEKTETLHMLWHCGPFNVIS